MPLGRGGSFGVGAAMGIACVLSWTLKPAAPPVVERHVAAPSAWMWTPRTASWSLVPYARPLHEPALRRALDGAILAAEGSDRAVQRLDDGGGRFVLLAVAPAEETVPPAPHDERIARVSGGTWLAGTERTTYVLRSGAWVPGPAIPEHYSLLGLAALEAGRLVVLCDDPVNGGSSAEGEILPCLCTAREGEAGFRAIRAPQIAGYRYNTRWVMAAAGEGEVAVVSRSDESGQVRTQLVDVDTGAVRDGPAGPQPFPAVGRGPIGPNCPRGCWGAGWASLDDGRLLLAPVVDAMERTPDPRATAARIGSAIAVVLTGSSVALLAALRRRIEARWAIAGLVAPPVLAAVVGFALAVLVAMSLRL